MSDLDARGLPNGYPLQPDWELTPREVRDLRAGSGRMLLVDVRTAQERGIACISGSVHVPLAEIESRVEELRAHEEDLVVTVCHHGMRSLRAAAALRRAGFSNVRSLAGGIHLWSMDIDPAVPIY